MPTLWLHLFEAFSIRLCMLRQRQSIWHNATLHPTYLCFKRLEVTRNCRQARPAQLPTETLSDASLPTVPATSLDLTTCAIKSPCEARLFEKESLSMPYYLSLLATRL